MNNWWIRFRMWFMAPIQRRRMGKFFNRPAPPPLPPDEQRRYDEESDEMIAGIYADRSGYSVEFVTPEEWAERYNRIPAPTRLAHRNDPTPGVFGFIEPVAPYRTLICCHQSVQSCTPKAVAQDAEQAEKENHG